MPEFLAVFGAGASHGSDDPSGVPPLASDLLHELARVSPEWRSLRLGSWGDRFRLDFEQAMTDYAKLGGYSLPRLQRDMARFFFTYRPGSRNLYLRLGTMVAETQEWNGAFATLNYERLLPISLWQAGVGFSTPGLGRTAGRTGREVELCLPHGSCCLFLKSIRVRPGVSYVADVKFDDQVVAACDEATFRDNVERNAVTPVMCYFDRHKQTSAGPTFIQVQRQRYADLVREARAIAVVGLKVRRVDKHIWEPLAQTKADIVYCAGESAGKAFTKWAKENRPAGNSTVLDGYFEEHFDDIGLALGLTGKGGRLLP